VLSGIEEAEGAEKSPPPEDIFATPMAFDAKKATALFHTFLQDTEPLPDLFTRLGLEKEELFPMIRPALDRLVRQVERTMEHFVRHYESEQVSRIFVSGPVASRERLVGYIGEQLGVETEAINPFPASAAIAPVVRKPKSAEEKDALVPAVGMALSSNAITPNFIFTYKDRDRQDNLARIRRIAMGCCTLLLVVCLGWSWAQYSEIEDKTTRNEVLVREADLNAPYADRNMILQMVIKIRQNNQKEGRYSGRFLSSAAFGEVCAITPSGVRLADVRADFGPLPKKNQKQKPARILIEGVIEGGRLKQEAELAEYLERLKTSPIFAQPKITAKEMVTIDKREVLMFTASASLL